MNLAKASTRVSRAESLAGAAIIAVAAEIGCSGGSNDTSPGAAKSGTANGSSGAGSGGASGGSSGASAGGSSSGTSAGSSGTSASSGGTSSGGTSSGGTSSGGTRSGGTSSGGTSSGGTSSGGTGSSSRGTSTTPGSRGAGGMAGDSGLVGGGSGAPAGSGVCDIFASGSTPCRAAHSTVRALYGAYKGNLYQVTRASDNTTKDIGVLATGGFADGAAQDTFCAATTCTISIISDQSSQGNHLTPGPAGQHGSGADKPSNATDLKTTASGHEVYGIRIRVGMGYRNDKATGTATGDAAETEYMVSSQNDLVNSCCYDYGNAE